MTLSQVPPRKHLTTHEYVVATLRQSLLDGAFPGGARLRQVELAEKLGVSTTPVREAFRELAAEGLVTLDARRGAIVKPLDLAAVREIYELRLALEPIMIARVIHNIPANDLEIARDLHREMLEVRDAKPWSELNRQFHAQFYLLEAKTRLGHILDGLRDGAAIYVARSLATAPEHIAEANREHGELLDHFTVGDLDKAVDLTLRHYSTTLRLVVDAFGKSSNARDVAHNALLAPATAGREDASEASLPASEDSGPGQG